MIVLIHALLLLLSGLRAATYENTTWIYPPGCEYCNTGLEIHYGDAMSVVWNSTWQADNNQNSLHMFCGETNLEPLQRTVPNAGNYTVHFENINLENFPLPIQCHYSLGIGDYTGNGSSYFELLSQDPNLAPKTWSATATPSSTVPSTPASTTPVSVNSSGSSTFSGAAKTIRTSEAASAIQSSPSSSFDLSTGTKAGIGVVSVVGGLAILAALGIFTFCTRRRRRRQQQQQQQEKTSAEKGSFSSLSDDLTTQGPHGIYSRKPELDAGQTKYEMAAAGDGQETGQQHQHAKELEAAAAINSALRAELEADGVSHQLD